MTRRRPGTGLRGGRRDLLLGWAPIVLAAAGAAAYLVVRPASADLAAHVYRAGIFDREGFAVWDGGWYGGHHLPGYSLVFPPLEGWLGPRPAGALAAVAAAAAFAALARAHWGRTPPAGLASAWFGLGTVTLLLTGRLAFGCGAAFALAAVLALQRRRPGLAAFLGAAASLSSPVAGLFAALAGGAVRSRAGLGLAAASLAPIGLFAIAFPEGGTEPFAFSSLWPVPLLTAATLWLAPREERALRAGAVLYCATTLFFFVVPSPVGGNMARLGPLLAGPIAAALLLARRPRVLLTLALPLLWWQWSAAIRDVDAARGDPSTRAGYYAGLIGFLARAPGAPARLEIPFTRNHWEAALVAPRFPLGRGWTRQLDRRYNAVFYRPLTPGSYRRWLDDLAVRWIALPDVDLDYSARDEARLLRSGLPYLRPAWRDSHWRVWEVRRSAPLARGPARLAAYASDELRLVGRRAGRTVLQVRWTPYWALDGAPGCVEEAPGGWTAVRLRRPGPARLVTRFALGRVGADSPRCG